MTGNPARHTKAAETRSRLLVPLPDVPMVSVLTLAYNHEAFVAESVESVLAQGWPEDRLQYVVINDASTDGTARALDPYRDNVTIIDHDENQGLLPSLDEAMSHMTGDVICGCAGDDAMKPGRIERLVRALQENPEAGLVYSDMQVVDSDGNLLWDSFLDAHGYPRLDGRIRGRLLAGNFISGGSLMLRGCLKDLVHPTPGHVAWEDYWWAWAISGVADIVHVPEPTYLYRLHGQNMSLGADAGRFGATIMKELPFRRFMFASVEPSEATATEIVVGIATLWRLLEYAPPEAAELLVPTDEERAEAQRWLDKASTALHEADLDAAALACARAGAAYVLDPALVAIVVELAGRLSLTDTSAAAPDRSILEQHGARAFVVLVDAQQLIDAPELLDAYAKRFGADADATLLIHARAAAWSALSTAIPQLAASRGLDGDDAPDMVFTTESPERLSEIAAVVDAILGHDVFESAAPHFSIGDLDGLHLVARHRWTADARVG